MIFEREETKVLYQITREYDNITWRIGQENYSPDQIQRRCRAWDYAVAIRSLEDLHNIGHRQELTPIVNELEALCLKETGYRIKRVEVIG